MALGLNAVSSMSFSPDGKYIVSSSDKESVISVCEVSTGKCVETLTGHSGIVARVIFSPDGWHIASGGYDNSLKIWNFLAPHTTD